ncbi:S-layer homology domain-containing protein [Sporomusa sp.]|uniref:S-layer homology domain-containing protein n=1 Tax=Sporomusa sp. TaxID=2078658 RepID=UPI002BF23598|nr:S-layer homology domain-containing protein [Sporomusa sp.]HWR41724.1 S-layer homology domain-containing protein [Sporomusa sp.]
MKKNLATTLALVLGLSMAGNAFAANPFNDLPAKHWSYEAVQKLANDGIVTGSGDGAFRGDRAISRYEMAVIVAKAMAHADKADAADKALIDKLSVEFKTELEGLNVRLTKVENKMSNVKFSGDVRERYEWTKVTPGNDATALKTRLRLNLAAQLTDDLTFNGRYFSESNVSGNNSAYVDLAYLSGQVLDGVNFTLGRMAMPVGKGITSDTWHNWDGAKISFGNKVKVSAGAAKYHAAGWDSPNYAYGDMAYAFTPNFDMRVAYFTDSQDSNQYKTKAVGFGYAFDKFNVKGEYASNASDIAKNTNNDSAAKAWYGKVKYMGADGSKDHSYGIWVGYRKADKNFDPLWWSTPDSTDTAYDKAALNDTKGFEYGFEYTLFKNGILSMQYNDVTDKKGNADNRRNFITNLSYSF